MNLAADVPVPIRSLYFEGCRLANLPQTRDAGRVFPWGFLMPLPGSAPHSPHDRPRWVLRAFPHGIAKRTRGVSNTHSRYDGDRTARAAAPHASC